jgi:hypothetical protein
MAKSVDTPHGLKKVFVGGLIAWYAMNVLQLVQLLWQQAGSNPNFSGYTSWIIWQVVPLVLFGVAFFLHPRKNDLLQRVFESLLMVMAALLVWAVVSQAITYAVTTAWSFSPGSFMLYDLLGAALVMVGFAGVLIYLVRFKRLR